MRDKLELTLILNGKMARGHKDNDGANDHR
jgi:hypothetical protein